MSTRIGVGALGALAVVLAPQAVLGQALTIDQALEEALANNPDLKILAAGIDAAEAQLEGASLFSQFNPEVSLSAGPRFRPEGTVVDVEVGASQTLEVFGQRAARRASAQAALREAQAQFRARRAEVAAQTRIAFGAVLAAHLHVDLAQEAAGLAREAIGAARARQEAGAAARLEVNAARAEQGRAARQALAANVERRAALATLRLLIARDAGAPLDVSGALPTTSVAIAPIEALLETASKHRADLVAAKAHLESQQAAVALADRLGKPAPTLGVAYAREEGDDDVVLGSLSLPLPFFNRNQADRGVVRSALEQARHRLAALERRVAQEVGLAAARLEAAGESLSLYQEGVLDALEENLAMSIEAYGAGKLDFLGLQLVRRQVLEGRADFIRVQQELNDAHAALDGALGVMP